MKLGVRLAWESGNLLQTAEHVLLSSDNRAGALAIAADARLDNREELARKLDIPLDRLSHLRDSEIILHAYRRWGIACPIHLLGAFSFAIWDEQERRFFCARDHVGLRAAYYSFEPSGYFTFANRITEILQSPLVSDAPNESYIASYLLDRLFVHPEQTFFRAIRRIPPAHSLTVRDGTATLRRYWSPDNVPEVRFKTREEYIDAFLHLFQEATRVRLPPDGPVGVHLTGGLDSSSIVAVTSRLLRQAGRPQPECFSWQPPPGASTATSGEHRRIALLCEQEELAPHFQHLRPEDVVEEIELDPMRQAAYGRLVHERPVQRLAHELGVNVILSGLGGDEGISFNGAGYYPGLLLRGNWQELWKVSRESAVNPIWFAARRALWPLTRYGVHRVAAAARANSRPHDESFINREFLADTIPLPPMEPLTYVDARGRQRQRLSNGLIAMQAECWATSGEGSGITYRYPLLDKRVLEFALGLPISQYCEDGKDRSFMRRAMKSVLPDEIRTSHSKLDPVRVQHLKGVFPEGIKVVRERLLSRTTPPHRALYLDYPRLLADLTDDSLATRTKWGSLVYTLQFLDL